MSFAEAMVDDESSNIYRDILQNALDGFFLADAEGRFLDVNEALVKLLGYNREEFHAMRIPDIVANEDPQEVPRRIARVLQAGSHRFEARKRRKDGRIVDVEVSARLIPGAEPCIAVFVRDLTDWKWMEDSLGERETKYCALVETTGTGYVILDEEGRVVDANQEYLRLTRRGSFEEIHGHRVTEWTAPHDLERNSAEVKKCAEQGFVRDLQIDYSDLDGQLTPIEINAQVLQTKHGPRIITLCRDITARRKSEEALRESEERLRAIFDHAAVGIVMSSTNGKFLRANKAFSDFIGYSVEELQSMDFRQITHPDHLIGDVANVQACLEGRQAYYETEKRYVRKDGQIIWGRINVGFLRNQAGEPLHSVGVIQDISERKKAEQILLDSEEKFRSLFESMTEGVALHEVIYGPDGLPCDYRILDINPAYELHTGISERQAKGCLASALYGTGSPPYLEEFCATAADGMARYMEVHFEPLKRHFSVGIVSPRRGQFATIFEDITERKRKEEALAEATQRLRLATASGHLGVWDWDLQMDQLTWDERMHEMYGIKQDTFHGGVEAWRQALHPEDREAAFEATQAALKGDRDYNTEFRVVHPDGSVKHLKADGIVIRNGGGKPLRMIGINRDITDVKNAESERRRLESEIMHAQKLESLGSLAGGVAHDMNNILTAIQGMASLLQIQHAGDAALQATLETVLQASNRGRDLVRSLTNFARKGLEEPRPVDLNETVSREVELLKRTTLQKITISSELDDPLPRIKGEPSSLGNMLMNLCVNAIDAMPEGGSLHFQTRRLPMGLVELSVRDTGHGMSPEVLERAMEPFYTTKPAGKGTGLGLSMVYGTVKAHGGTAHIESVLGQGTTIRLRFPILPEDALSSEHKGQEHEEPAKADLAILLVDDDHLIRDTFPAMVEVLGHHVVGFARAGREALDHLEAGLQVDLVVLDQNMPGLTGTETLARLRETHPEMPVVLSTGFLDLALQEAVETYNGVWTLPKPYFLKDLRKVLGEIAKERAERRS